ncbi:sodium/glucose cotransporter 4-like isoform X2 [Tubulanus polymorphus]|uniref:sodium/glucose cotransporter 4-like isoform X2 n=1 Tax=Tubulanus polymorphus TaxID=672921 RepID=UPI003DA49A0E
MPSVEEEKLLKGTNLEWPDIVVIVLYFVIILGFGIWSSTRNRGSVGGYFLAGRNMHWMLVGGSLFASNIGSGHFVGLAGSGAASGIGIAVFELNAIFILLLLGWIFVPVYIAAGVFTMPEYLRKRFGGQRIRVYLAILALLLYIFTKISADLYAGAVFIQQSLQFNLYVAIVILLAISAIFTITGGLTAVIWTDFIQTIIMIIGAFVLMILGFVEVGGFQQLALKYFESAPTTSLNSTTACGLANPDAFHLFRDVNSPDLPWTGVIFGLTVSGVWYWCSDQVIVQRALAAKNLSHAKGGTILAGYLKFLPLFLLVFPGMMARILFPDTVGCSDPESCKKYCGKERGCSDIAYPMLVLKLMPVGARGMMLACMMAALMSSLTSIFNSGSTIFTIDVWKRMRKNASDVELMIVGRVFVLVLVGVGIAWIPVVQSGSELFHYIQAVTSYLAPPICAVYVLAVLWKRINEQGAFWGLMIGLVTGMIRFGWEFSYTVPPCGQEHLDTRPSIIKDVHYLHFGIILFFVVAISTTIISLVTKEIPDDRLVRLTFWTRHETRERLDISDIEDEEAEKKNLERNEVDSYGSSKTATPAASVDNVAGSQGHLVVEEQNTGTETNCCKRAFFWICGIERMRDQSEPQVLPDDHTSIKEQPRWKTFTDINAIILMVLAIFMWGFFY